MYQRYVSLPTRRIEIDLDFRTGAFEWWRHSIGHGGINSRALPTPVVEGARKLRPRLVRTFIQEYFNLYPDHGTFDWTRLDPYMEALHRTGADVVASITFKPQVLYPTIDQNVWRPNDVSEWQRVVHELVKRYSVEQRIVTYWEIGNETDIGEPGGCPFLIKDANEYLEYYKLTTEPILKAFPEAKIGGPAVARPRAPLFFNFIDLCHSTGTRLDFVSWHLYNDDPNKHKQLIIDTKERLAQFGERRPEMLVTEWSKSFDNVSIEELAMMPKRAAATATTILAMMDAGLDWSFYYHVWDQTFYPEEFAGFYHDLPNMITHWNEVPHRFGLFGVSGEVRPQYFVYQMMSRMGDQRIYAVSDDPDLRVCAVTDHGRVSVMIANYAPEGTVVDKLATIVLRQLSRGPKILRVYRIDEERRWNEEQLELIPYEQREIDSIPDRPFSFQVYCPTETVTFITIEPAE